MKKLLLYASIGVWGGLLFGFDVAIITGAGPFVTRTFGLNSIEEGWAYSSLLFGCIAGAAVAGRLSDTWGRKSILIVVALLFAITSVGSALACNLTSFIVARVFGGLAVGAVSVVAPIFISEVSPSQYRGRLVSAYQLFIVAGVLVSYFISYLLYDIGGNNWRWMFAFGALPPVFFLFMLLSVSETPRFLYLKGQKEKALEVLKHINGPELAALGIEKMEKSIKREKPDLRIRKDHSIRKLLMIGFVMALLLQMSGINIIINYAPKLFLSSGWDLNAGLFATFGIGLVNFIATGISILIIDKYGRRCMYIVGSAGMTITLTGIAMVGCMSVFSGMVALILIVLFCFFFATFIGPVFWTYLSEIFPNRVRGTAMSIPTFTQWIFNALIVLLFPLMLVTFDMSVIFGLLAVFAFFQFLFSVKYMKETKGKSLEEIENLWN